jgi:hypothetical protein
MPLAVNFSLRVTDPSMVAGAKFAIEEMLSWHRSKAKENTDKAKGLAITKIEERQYDAMAAAHTDSADFLTALEVVS